MSTTRKLSIIAAIASIFVASAVSAAQRDAGAKMRGEFGTGFDRRPVARSTMAYRTYQAPAVAMPAPRAPLVAEAPQQARTFSYEPRTEVRAPVQCQAQAPAVNERVFSYEPVQPVAPAYRSYSYEPNYGTGTVQQERRSRIPSYALPKTDARKFSGGR